MGLFIVVLLNFIRSMIGIEDWVFLVEKIEIYWYLVVCDGLLCFCFKLGKLDIFENIFKKYF